MENTIQKTSLTLKTPLPEGLIWKNATLLNSSGESFDAKAAVKEWDDSERKSRAIKRTFKIVGGILGVSLIGLFVHILLIVIIPTVILTLMGSVFLYLRFLDETATVYYFRSENPKINTDLRPYLNTQLQEEMTAQFTDSGETIKVKIEI
ncbi:MAG: hypothetical protein CL678_07865 [Bdellovibrionaceae bacterium]|nr:hypothetical protein [Pseudobdellovibrionaceae bacterium]|tara:strand:- start:2019 stop:2468 length:450 start_codon:yes stop_codon:yes gene_type:complete